ncbi:WD40-repeat-containing domain protein [Blastocladiella britannica]|nr:WD40-repeat-containing domain protein [Blastocladiella britannica]
MTTATHRDRLAEQQEEGPMDLVLDSLSEDESVGEDEVLTETPIPSEHSTASFVPDWPCSPRLVASSGNNVPSRLPMLSPDAANYARWCAWSPDATMLATAHADRTVRIWDSAAFLAQVDDANTSVVAAEIAVADSITDAAWWPHGDGRKLAVAAPNLPVRLHSLEAPESGTGATITSAAYSAHDERSDTLASATALAFSPTDAAQMLVGYTDGFLVPFDLTRPGLAPHGSGVRSAPTRAASRKLGLYGLVSSIVYLPGYAAVASASYARAIGIYDARTLKVAHVMRGFKGAPTTLAADPATGGTYIAAACRAPSGDVSLWDVRDVRAPVWSVPRARPMNMRTSIAWATPTLLAVGGCSVRGNEVWAIDAATGSERHVVAASSDGASAAAWCSVSNGEWWAVVSGERRTSDPSADRGLVQPEHLDNGVRVWQVAGQWTWA